MEDTGVKVVPVGRQSHPKRIIQKKDVVAFPSTKFFTGIVNNPGSVVFKMKDRPRQ
ncbi:MAG: hypothetical protein ACYS6W_14630 [Planctomycetota bacterium]|jgi:hypothetical protein